jgi:peptide/nickel transport system substrate-binding protein
VLQDSPFARAIKGYIPVPGFYRQDLGKAREFLAKSATPNGGVELEYVYFDGLEEERKMGLVLIDNLGKLNLKVKMTPMTWPNMVARGSKVETSPDFLAVFTTPVSTDPDAVAYQYHKNSFGKYYASHFYSNDAVWALIDKARITTKWEQRAPLYAEIQKRITDDAPEIFGMLMNRRWGMRDHVKGFVFSPVRFTGEVDLYPLQIVGK